jgi:hypothetical protein
LEIKKRIRKGPLPKYTRRMGEHQKECKWNFRDGRKEGKRGMVRWRMQINHKRMK